MKEELVGNTITYHDIKIDENQKVHARVTIETANAVEDYTLEAESLSGLYGLVVVEMANQEYGKQSKRTKKERENTHE